jgi:hypothetical protein
VWKGVLAVVLGYVAMFLVVFLALAAAYALLGAEGAFESGVYLPSTAWIVTMIVVGIIAALVGGCVCATIAGSGSRAPLALAALVLVLGLLMAVPSALDSGEGLPSIRPDGVGMFEAMENARQPLWVALLNPLLGAGGVLVGGRLKKK